MDIRSGEWSCVVIQPSLLPIILIPFHLLLAPLRYIDGVCVYSFILLYSAELCGRVSIACGITSSLRSRYAKRAEAFMSIWSLVLLVGCLY